MPKTPVKTPAPAAPKSTAPPSPRPRFAPTRRRFLQQMATSAAIVAAPTVFIPRFAHATEGFGQARHLLVLFARGGFRSHCTFNAPQKVQHNPFGRHAPLAHAEWRMGAHVRSANYQSVLGDVPALRRIAGDVAVLPSVDHTPGQAGIDIDHRTASNRICTGSPEGRSGLLSIVGKHHPLFANGFDGAVMPPVEIMPTEYGLGEGDYAVTRPLSVLSAENSFAGGATVSGGWKAQARAALNQRFLDGRSRTFARRLDNYGVAKENAVRFGAELADATLNVIGAPDAVADGVSNAELLSVLGNYTLDQIGDPQAISSWGADVGLAMRFFGKGSPMCVVTRNIYDLHDGEASMYAPRSNDLVRQLCGLNFLLKRMAHPEGGTFWDKTMVAVVSEFSRNNTMETGFNSGQGSDHVQEASGPTRNQAVALMGGPVQAGGRLLGSCDLDMNATGTVFSSQSLLATFLDALGIAPDDIFPDAPIAGVFS